MEVHVQSTEHDFQNIHVHKGLFYPAKASFGEAVIPFSLYVRFRIKNGDEFGSYWIGAKLERDRAGMWMADLGQVPSEAIRDLGKVVDTILSMLLAD